MELGFSFSEPDYAHSPGFPELRIHIYAHPTEEHFDPKIVSLNLVTEDGVLDEYTVVHPWYFRQKFRAGPGQVVMIDRKGKEERAVDWLPEIDFHNQLLAQVDAMVLYAACLRKLRQKFEEIEQQQLDWAGDFYEFLVHEIGALKEIRPWPDHVPDLEMLI